MAGPMLNHPNSGPKSALRAREFRRRSVFPVPVLAAGPTADGPTRSASGPRQSVPQPRCGRNTEMSSKSEPSRPFLRQNRPRGHGRSLYVCNRHLLEISTCADPSDTPKMTPGHQEFPKLMGVGVRALFQFLVLRKEKKATSAHDIVEADEVRWLRRMTRASISRNVGSRMPPPPAGCKR